MNEYVAEANEEEQKLLAKQRAMREKSQAALIEGTVKVRPPP
jgi:hypothetical protein